MWSRGLAESLGIDSEWGFLSATKDARRPKPVPTLYDADVINLDPTDAVSTGIERPSADGGVLEIAPSSWTRFV